MLYSNNTVGSTTKTYGTRVRTSSLAGWPATDNHGSTGDWPGDTGADRGAVRVLVAESHEVYRGGLLAILHRSPQVRVVGEVDDGPSCLAAADRLRPDVILVDLDLCPMGGVEVVRRLMSGARSPAPRIIALASRDDDEPVTEALRVGARGCLCKTTSARALLDAIESVAGGGAALDPAVAQRLIDGLAGAAVPLPRIATGGAQRERWPTGAAYHPVSLTARQGEVLRLVAEGLSNGEIALRLHVSEATVKSHLSALLRKLNLRDRTQLAVYALRHGSRAGTGYR